MPVRIAILGGGPAGLAAAWLLQREKKADALVVEQRDHVGGNAGSFELAGIPVDFGSHRLHPSCEPRILSDLRALLGDDLLSRPRHGRIRLQGRWLHFPLRPLDLLAHVPPRFAVGIARDTLRKLIPGNATPQEETFASELEQGLGSTICGEFYFPYARKIWGLPPEQLSPTQARRRVSAGSLAKMLGKVINTVPGIQSTRTDRFFYPREGYGQISAALAAAAVASGAEIQLGRAVSRIHLGSTARIETGEEPGQGSIDADLVWSTIPITTLSRAVDPPPPASVLEAVSNIEYRAMILIYLVLSQPRFTEYDAHYFPEAAIGITRLSEPRNYSGRSDLPQRTVLCAELPCATSDRLWKATDTELGDVVRDALERCGLPIRAPVLQVATRRLPHAYPIYRKGYESSWRVLDQWASGLDRVLTFGRQGLFAHDNTHHTLAMAYAAVGCLDSSGRFDRARWDEHRVEFDRFVVED